MIFQGLAHVSYTVSFGMTMKLGFLLLASLLLACSPEDSRKETVPEPTSVAQADIAEDSDLVYYLAVGGDDFSQQAAEQLLLALLADDISIANAWYPQVPSPCLCGICVACVVVELAAPEQGILMHGFIDDPASELWVCNCGVDQFWQYTF